MTPPFSHHFDALGTQWVIETLESLGSVLTDEIEMLVDEFDRTYSRFRPDSLVSLLRSGGTQEFPGHAVRLFELYETLYELSDGKVTPLIGEALEAAGYDAQYSLKAQAPRPAPALDGVYVREGRKVTLHQPALIDIGAAGKGLLVDLIAELLEGKGVSDYVVDGSGDLKHRGALENRVGLEDPRAKGKVIGSVEITDRALAASATNRRSWGGGWHHVLDPTSGLPAGGVSATWVVVDTAMIADALATALFFCEPETLARRYNYEYIRMHDDGTAIYSPLFKGKLF